MTAEDTASFAVKPSVFARKNPLRLSRRHVVKNAASSLKAPSRGSASRRIFIRKLGDQEPKRERATVPLPCEQQLPRRMIQNDI